MGTLAKKTGRASAPTKTAVVNVRFDPPTLGLIERAAANAGMSVSAYLTTTAVAKARTDILDERYIALNEPDFDAVEAQIEREQQPHPGLARLMATQFEWMDG
ncbi:MAG: DUF1778 domain-containing protein [Rhizobiaceae bacterium]|jgi:uncharacterized protein (DUF1778 family)|nr:DUF1778 domain-containing protein [Rhizobiaceae bacterium]